MGVNQAERVKGCCKQRGRHVQKAWGGKAYGEFEEIERPVQLCEKRDQQIGRAEAGGADAPWRPRWNFALRVLGSHGRVQKLGRNWGPERLCSLLLSVSSLPPTAPLPFQSPSSLRPWPPRCSPPAHRGSGLRPPRAASAAPLHRRRRHLPLAAVTLRNHCTRRVAGKWSPLCTSASAPTARATFRPPPLRSPVALHFRLSGAMPLGKCSPVTGGGTERGLEASGKWSSRRLWFPGRLVFGLNRVE